MSKSKILIQLDPDPNPSTFDSVVAIDSGVEQLLTHGNVTPESVIGLVHGAMFTRGPEDLKSTALFFGGSNVEATQALVDRSLNCFFGQMSVSVMADPNGCNTTAAAAVLCAEKHLSLMGTTVTVLAGTGPVGQRIAQIIGKRVAQDQGRVTVRVCSRKRDKALAVCETLKKETRSDAFVPCGVSSPEEALSAIDNAQIVFGAGAAGIELLPQQWQSLKSPPRIAIDLNAVPPAGIAGIDVMDAGQSRGETICYGAIGVGGLKMKIHKRCIAALFERNDQVLRVNEIYKIGRELVQ